jgi:hypothetical protein
VKYKALAEAAVVVPRQAGPPPPFWMPQSLGSGSVVKVMRKKVPSPLTGQSDEITVRWVDVVGREFDGWLARDTKLRATSAKKCTKKSTGEHMKNDKIVGGEPMTSWDHLRERIAGFPNWNAVQWVSTFGATNLPLLHAVIRQLGGKVPVSDEPTLAIRRVLRLITGKEISMSTIKKSRKAAKVATTTSGKKGSAKKGKASRGAAGTGRTSAFSGQRIIRLVKENPRRKGTAGWKSWNLLKKGMTYEQYIEAGGRRGDLAWDLDRKNVKLVSAK